MYALIDADNFFVSCERVFRPDLQNKPLLVLSSNDGCVVSRSKEVKQMGIAMGAPYFQIKDEIRTKKIAYFSSNFDLYGDMSRRLMRTIWQIAPTFEPYSVDECFINFYDFHQANLPKFCKDLREHIWRTLGIPVSIGLAPTKTLAKLAAGQAKKSVSHFYDLQDIESEKAREIFDNTPVSEVWGIGSATARNLRSYRVYNVSNLCGIDRDFLQRNFSISTEHIWEELHGKPVLINPPSARKSLQVTRTFGQRVTNVEELKVVLTSFANKACAKLRKQGQEARFLSVQIRTSYFIDTIKKYSAYDQITLPEASNQNELIIKEATKLVDQLYKVGYEYSKAGLTLSGLQEVSENQGDLFCDQEKKESMVQLLNAVDKINRRDNLIQVGYVKKQTKHFSSKSQKRSQGYTTDWQELREVR